MRRLILMRHAKSDWSTGAKTDHARPLNARGRQASARLGQWLKDNGIVPDEVLCSTAARTQETFAGLALPSAPVPKLVKELYLADRDTILTALRAATGAAVMILGHNPGIAAAAAGFVAQPLDHPQFQRYPTGATLIADFDVHDWQAAAWSQASAQMFVVPRDL
ncbi:MAG: histidine phosphatase family protein [Pseudomonadota bacterium]